MSISLVGGPKDDVFVGRQAELSSLLEVVTRVEEGRPWLVTVEGESGIGKTALVKRGLASARGFRALSARSDQSETDLEYGVIEQAASQCRRPAARPVPAAPRRRREVFSVRGRRGTVGRAG